MTDRSLRVRAADAILFARDLIAANGHNVNEVCHRFEGGQGYCVGMAVILGSQADGRSYSDARAALCKYETVWDGRGVGGVLVAPDVWWEARRWVAWAWGFPRHQEPNEWGETAAVTPNQYAKKHGISPVPYLENAAALARDETLPHALAPLPCWDMCEAGCGTVIPDPDGLCVACDEKERQAREVRAHARR